MAKSTPAPTPAALDTYFVEPEAHRRQRRFRAAVAALRDFWGSLKTEHVYRREFKTRAEAERSIFLWIEGWYNRRRHHSALGYQSPEQFEASLN